MTNNKTKQQIFLKPNMEIIAVYKNDTDTYWFITDTMQAHDTQVKGKIYKDDKLLFGYMWFPKRSELIEFGFISQIDLEKTLGTHVSKVSKNTWPFCKNIAKELSTAKWHNLNSHLSPELKRKLNFKSAQ
jgi:hypothetical protein